MFTTGQERIRTPDETRVVQQTMAALSCTRRSVHEARVLITSDDQDFQAAVARRLAAMGVAVALAGGSVPALAEANQTAASACDSSCVAPLFDAVAAFGRARVLILSTGSNMGGFMLSAWGAVNGDETPQFLDVDGRLHQSHLARGGLYFCELQWGSRHGLCTGPDYSVKLGATPGPNEVQLLAIVNRSSLVATQIKELVRAHKRQFGKATGRLNASTTNELERIGAAVDATLSQALAELPFLSATFLPLMEKFLDARTMGAGDEYAMRAAEHEASVVVRQKLLQYQVCL